MCMEYTEHIDDVRKLSGIAVKRKHKATVFERIFGKKKALLSLYNAVNGTHYENVEDLEITTLENAIYMNMKNDISFVFAFELNLYEHQSTVNPNIPLRNLFYVSKQLQGMVPGRQLYSSRRLKIPVPRFMVFYNGKQDMPEQMEYRLSDLYAKHVEHPELELRVTVLNINPGKNEELMQACRLLKEYMLFTAKVRENLQSMDLNTAVNKAVDDCIREGILAEFLEKERAEVVAMCIFEYDEEAHMQLIREETWEEAWEKGRQENGFEVYLELIKDGYPEERALEIAKITRQEMQEMQKN